MVRVWMEPLADVDQCSVRFFWPGLAGQERVFWSVTVAPWPEDFREGLPDGMEMTWEEGERVARGRLSWPVLCRWVEGVPAGETAAALRGTLSAHREPLRGLAWGRWQLAGERVHLMGVVNVTPDSFSDGGRNFGCEAAIAHGLELVAAGAELLDVGGESTRPGAVPVSEEEELRRVIPVIAGLASLVPVPISVDTSKFAVMKAALGAGASVINDVTALGRLCEGEGEQLAAGDGPIILMHMQGSPSTMQRAPRYREVAREVYDFLARRLLWCERVGIRRERLWVDPGIGFGKLLEHNLDLVRRLPLLRGLGVPIVVGVSRKRMVGELTGVAEPVGRDPGSHVLGGVCALNGARWLRVHDVGGARQALAVIRGFRGQEFP